MPLAVHRRTSREFSSTSCSCGTTTKDGGTEILKMNISIYEMRHDKTNKMTVQRLRSAWVSAQSEQSLCFPHEETLDP